MSETTTTPAEAQENEATDEGYNVFQLDGVDLRVKPVTQWRPSYLRAIRQADFDTWAAGVLHEDDVETFVEINATFEEIGKLTQAIMEDSGEAPGKSSARSARSRSTRKR